jgi:sugar-phosphatase
MPVWHIWQVFRARRAGLPVPEVLVTPESVRNGKPHPEPYLVGAQRMGAHMSECLVVEDAPAGVQAGLTAATHVIALLTTHSRADLPGAHDYIATLHELWPAVRRLHPNNGSR